MKYNTQKLDSSRLKIYKSKTRFYNKMSLLLRLLEDLSIQLHYLTLGECFIVEMFTKSHLL
jgi:hypothetical protein